MHMDAPPSSAYTVASSRSMNIVLFGEGGVGKSALALRFCFDHFVDAYDPTIEDTFSHTILVDGKAIRVNIIDTAGSEQFVTMRDLYIKSGDGFVLVWSLTDYKSLQELTRTYHSICRLKDTADPPVLLVANKSDTDWSRSEVDERVKQCWNQARSLPSMFASAKENKNVQRCFEEVVRLVLQAPDTNPKDPNTKSAGRRTFERLKKNTEGRCVIL